MASPEKKTKQGSKRRLSPRQTRFCEEFILNPKNATQAYISAGYSGNGAGQSATKLLKNTNIQRYLKKLQADIDMKYQITRERILKERARIAFFDIRGLYHKDGTIKVPEEWDGDISAVVSSFKVKERKAEGEHISSSRVLEVKLHSKDSSLQALEKIEGFYEKDNSQKRPYEDLSDEELERRIAELERKTGRR